MTSSELSAAHRPSVLPNLPAHMVRRLYVRHPRHRFNFAGRRCEHDAAAVVAGLDAISTGPEYCENSLSSKRIIDGENGTTKAYDAIWIFCGNYLSAVN